MQGSLATQKTRLSQLHPYPAMLADGLAMEIAQAHIQAGDRVIDPFCGTGRTLMAAVAVGAHAVGVDINPLAVLVSRAKCGIPDQTSLQRLMTWMPSKRHENLEVLLGRERRVDWFPTRALRELGEIVTALNFLRLRGQTLDFAAAVLSATVRESCYCRKDQWKLHRMSPAQRSSFRPSAWAIFRRRLRVALDEHSACSVPESALSRATAVLGDARQLRACLGDHTQHGYDCIFSSPPYGDSRTTVQYGGMSSLSLDVLSRIEALDLCAASTAQIDTSCLGGAARALPDVDWLREYWPAPIASPYATRVACYLVDLGDALRAAVDVLRPGGRVVLILARRRVGPARVRVDQFAVDELAALGVHKTAAVRRKVAIKWAPAYVHRHGRSADRSGRVRTMREEVVLVFEKEGRTRGKVRQ